MNNRNTREAFLMHWGFKKGEEAKSHNPIVFLRTDDLIIKEEALDYVQERNGPDEWYDSNRIK